MGDLQSINDKQTVDLVDLALDFTVQNEGDDEALYFCAADVDGLQSASGHNREYAHLGEKV
jgi:hypothetical protein